MANAGGGLSSARPSLPIAAPKSEKRSAGRAMKAHNRKLRARAIKQQQTASEY
jgi:hypothetical protein